jgi:hypothetical protein
MLPSSSTRCGQALTKGDERSVNATSVNDDRRAVRWLMAAVALHVVCALAATLQRLAAGSQINNFLIFRSSFFHLLRGQDLYVLYPAEHFDLYKYSPTWALLFAPFAVVPIPIGVVLWNVANAVMLCVALSMLLPPRAAAWALLIAFFEALGAIQNAQSNGLVAALMILALVMSERQRVASGAWAVAIGTCVKVFPIGAGLFGLLDARRWRHLAWCMAAGVMLLALPLLVTPFETLVSQYRSWGSMGSQDHLSVEQAWVGGIIETALGRSIPHAPFQVIGVLWIGVTSWMASRTWSDGLVRRLLLASVLGFSVIFNHKGESPTYVIAFAGAGIWWAAMPRARWRDFVILALVVIGSLGGSDLFPKAWRHDVLPRMAAQGGHDDALVVRTPMGSVATAARGPATGVALKARAT